MVIPGKARLIRALEYPSDIYTQGLEVISPDQLLISSGRYGFSKVGIYDVKQEHVETRIAYPPNFFAEGLTIVGENFWLLSYKEEVATCYRLSDFKKLKEVAYQGQGWGLAYDQTDQCLWMTGGNHILQKRDCDTFSLLDEKEILLQGVPISRLNELEWVDGFLYANIWQTDKIVKVHPQTAEILVVYNLGPILKDLGLNKENYPELNYLNGIAHINDNRFFLTGKFFPLMIEVELC